MDRASLLIIDDERGPTESLRMVFKEDYDVFTAGGGLEAMEVLGDRTIDVVTLDLRMPGMGGNEAMELIKRYDPDIEIIVVTGNASFESAIRGIRHRIFDYVTKPFDVPHISKLVERAVTHRREILAARDFRDRFLANLSHELRTPLNAIMGFNEMLADQLTPQLSPEQRETFAKVHSHSKRMLTLIDTVTVLNQVEVGDYQMLPSTFDLSDVLEWLCGGFLTVAREQKISLRHEKHSTEASVTGDRDKIERLISALVDNALKFTPEGGSVTVTIASVEEGSVTVDVIDTGVGVPSEDIQELIEKAPTSVLPKPSVHTGLGLGLRLASELSRVMGADLSVRRQDLRGSCFSVRIPRQPKGWGSNAHVQ